MQATAIVLTRILVRTGRRSAHASGRGLPAAAVLNRQVLEGVGLQPVRVMPGWGAAGWRRHWGLFRRDPLKAARGLAPLVFTALPPPDAEEAARFTAPARSGRGTARNRDRNAPVAGHGTWPETPDRHRCKAGPASPHHARPGETPPSSEAQASPGSPGLLAEPISFGWPTRRIRPSAVTVQNSTCSAGCCSQWCTAWPWPGCGLRRRQACIADP